MKQVVEGSKPPESADSPPQNPPAANPDNPDTTESAPVSPNPSNTDGAKAEKLPETKPPEEKPQPKTPSGGVSVLTPLPEDRVQMNVLVTKELRDKAQAEANLAYEYGWIPSPTVTQFVIWTLDKYMYELLTKTAKQRREAANAGAKE